MKTSLYTILCTVIRLGAVLMAVDILIAFPATFHAAQNESWAQGSAWLVVATSTAVLLLAFLLWLFPGGLARLAASRSAHQVFESPISAPELQQIAFAVLGLWLVAGGLTGLSQELLRASLVARANGDAFLSLQVHEGAQLLACGIGILFGFVLTLGARGLSGLLYRLRNPSSSIRAAESASSQSEGNT